MELTNHTNASSKYEVIGPLIFNDEVVGVLQDKFILAKIPRKSITSYRLESRSSFKHPIVGVLLGGVLMFVPAQSVLGDPLGLKWLTLASPMRIAGSLSMAGFGLLLLVGVLRRREQPWIVFVCGSAELPFPLEKELTQEARAVLDAMLTGR